MQQIETERLVERRTGVALWRQIAEAIRAGLASDLVDDEGKLPPEMTLAERFGVNRHTIRAAIAALAKEGVVRAEQGRGTFVMRRGRLAYPIGRRTRFSAGLSGQARNFAGVLLEAATEPATATVADALGLAHGTPVIRIETLSRADGIAVSRATSWFEAARFGDIAKTYDETGSVTASLAAHGVSDYVRKSTEISASHASVADTRDLELSPGAIVLVAQAINTDLAGNPVQYAITRFAADRVELRVENET